MKRMKLKISLLITFLMISLQAWNQNLPENIEIIEKNLGKIFDSEKPGAVILIAKDGVPILKKAYGMADYKKRVPLRTDHSLAIGSLSKQFTAVAILMLEEQGKLSLDDDITKYFPLAENFRGITIEHLMNHTSGIPDLFKIQEWRKDLSSSHGSTI